MPSMAVGTARYFDCDFMTQPNNPKKNHTWLITQEKQTIMTTDADVVRRAALKAFMAAKGLKPHPWAQAAGMRSSALYNFLSGRTHSLNADSLQKLAKAANATVDEILSGKVDGHAPKSRPKEGVAPTTTSRGDVPLRWLVGVYGKMFAMEKAMTVPRPVGVPPGVESVAARVDGDGLHPIPSGWIVFFEAAAKTPEEVIGKLCVVRVRGTQQPLIREVRRGATPGLYTLLSWSASPLEEVEVVEAHPVLAITQG